MTVVALTDRQKAFSAKRVKSLFPIFHDNELTKHLAYLDNAATTHKPQQVIDAINRATLSYHAPVNRGFYKLGELSSDAYESARETVQEFIGATQSKSVIFTASATDSINQLAQIFLSERLKPGDFIWVSRMEHHANYLPWQALANQNQAELRIIELTDQGELDLSNQDEIFSNRTALITVTHTSNVLGVQNDIKTICAKAKKHDIPVCIDAAQAMVSNHIDVSDIGCDFLVFSGHKMFGPNGIGVLYISQERLESCSPTRLGGGMIDYLGESFEENIWSEAPQCFEAGSPNLPGAVGLAASCDFIDSLGQENIKSHIQSLTSYLYQELKQFQSIRITTPEKHLSSGIISFHHETIHAHDLAQILGDKNVAVRAGHHCAQPLLIHLGVSSTLRISVSVYNQKDDINNAVEALKTAEEIFS